MKCTAVPGGFVCGPSPRRKRCSCGELADLECDYPVGKPDPKAPKVGDCRINIYNRKVFFVWQVEPHGEVLVSRKRPTLQAVPRDALRMKWEVWFERTRATCDRAVCRRCVVRSGSLDFCPAHGREVAKKAKASEG